MGRAGCAAAALAAAGVPGWRAGQGHPGRRLRRHRLRPRPSAIGSTSRSSRPATDSWCHKKGDKFAYPADWGKLCPWLRASLNEFVRLLENGVTLPWMYEGTPYAEGHRSRAASRPSTSAAPIRPRPWWPRSPGPGSERAAVSLMPGRAGAFSTDVGGPEYSEDDQDHHGVPIDHSPRLSSPLSSALTLSAVLGAALGSQGQAQSKPARAESGPLRRRQGRPAPIKIDGVLDEEAWKNGRRRSRCRTNGSPGDNIPPPVETECLVTYDAQQPLRRLPLPRSRSRRRSAPTSWTATTPTRSSMDDHVSVHDRHLQRRAPRLPVPGQPARASRPTPTSASWRATRTSPGTPSGASAGRITDRRLRRRGGHPAQPAALPEIRQGTQTWGFEAERSWPRNVRHRIIVPRPRSRTSTASSASSTRSPASRASPRAATSSSIRPSPFSRTDAMDCDFPDGALDQRQGRGRARADRPSGASRPT
ncbi:MAG: hypothetical protein MZV63_63010 [Marinilabiliales bacterium]|nr:hypothetical protein [Marinilabiliales bacterium]